MTTDSLRSGSNIIPAIRYRDAPAAIAWLCDTFGFEERLVVKGEGNLIKHARLCLGGGMIMLGSVGNEETEYGKLIKQPDEMGGLATQSICLVVADADAVYVDYGKPEAKAFKRAAPGAMKDFEFPAGSMGPKVDAACLFAREKGNRSGDIGRFSGSVHR